MVSCLVILTDL